MNAAPNDAANQPPADADAPSPRRRRRAALAPVATGLLLLGATAWGLTLPGPGDAAPFHERVVEVALDAPLSVAGYRGRDAHVATEAVELLRPNVILSRAFVPDEDPGAGDPVGHSPWVQLLIVQCRDARDILGHWPPVCYEANGYTSGSIEDVAWEVDGRELPGRRYRFYKEDSGGGRLGSGETGSNAIVVANFLVLPNGRVVRDMADVTELGGDYRLRYFGAAQVQVLTPSGLQEEDRLLVEEAFLGAHAGLIATMLSGVTPSAPPAPAPAAPRPA